MTRAENAGNMTALDLLCSLDHVPMTMHGNLPRKASNSDLRRWLCNKSVLINGKRPGPFDPIEFPITELVFFPKNDRTRVTLF
jgi:hypothetical protein